MKVLCEGKTLLCELSASGLYIHFIGDLDYDFVLMDLEDVPCRLDKMHDGFNSRAVGIYVHPEHTFDALTCLVETYDLILK